MRRLAARFAVAVLALTACTSGTGNGPPDDPLPMIATDACPGPDDLLVTPASSGKRLPDVTLGCLGHDGEVPLRRLGKVPTVVNLWASWCFPCRTEMPEFQKVHKALGDRVRFLGVNTKDFERPARTTIQNTAISYPSVFDPEERVRRALGIRSLPATVLVDADGSIKDLHVGELTAGELTDLIEKHLGVT